MNFIFVCNHQESWCQATTKKNKNWEEEADAVLVVKDRRVILKVLS
jgi:hypothetical protein